MIRKQKNTVVPFLKKFSLGLVIALVVFAGGFFYWQWLNSPLAPQINRPGNFIVSRGESLSAISSRLKKAELIRNPWAFRIMVSSRGLSQKIQAGSFQLSSSMSSSQILDTLTHGVMDIWLTFPEGWRKEEYGRRLKANIIDFNQDEFRLLTQDLEGNLFPDTYLIPKQASPAAVIKIIRQNFEKRTSPLFAQEIPQKFTQEQVIILASLVERETKGETDRPIVAGILIKRWQNNWPLQVDATVQYTLANDLITRMEIDDWSDFNWWPKITKKDLEIDSLYNTYKYKGLPPAAICNPGLSSLKAVLNAQTSDYWYYLSDKDGKIHYSSTLEEHQQNISRYLK